MIAGPDRLQPFAFVDNLDEPSLSPADRHHLERVRRLRDGDELNVGDGGGRIRLVRFGAELQPRGDVIQIAAPEPEVVIAFALTKGSKPDLVVQKLVEIGVDRIVPFVADRTIVRWEADKADRSVERWRFIAREAAAQSHRPHLPVIDDITSFDQVRALPGAAMAHPEGAPLEPGTTTLLIGPEGGWSTAEERSGLPRVGIGSTILRAETAAVVAGTLATWLNRHQVTERG
jgi:16S rRNA (uracil1498-N3)-methyltransferase